MCGPRGFAAPLALVSLLAGEMRDGTGAGGCGASGCAADDKPAFLRRKLFDGLSICRNSFTIVRLVLTPYRLSNSAMASQDAPFSRNSMITSRHGWRLPYRGRRRGSNCAAAWRIRFGSVTGIRREAGGKLPGNCAGNDGGCPPEMQRQYPGYLPEECRERVC